MTALVAAFIFILAGVGLLGAALVGNRQGQAIVQKRIGLIVPGPTAERRAHPSESWLPQLEDGVEKFFALGLKRNWGATTKGRVLIGVGLVGGFIGWFVGHSVMGLPLILAVLLTAGLFYIAPRTVLSIEQSRADVMFTDRFPDAIDMVIRTLRAGLPVTTAIRTAANDAAEPVNAVFATLSDRVEMGMALDEALSIAGERIQLPDFRFFTVALALQHATGGNLAATLDILSDIIRKRRAGRLKARAVTSEVRMTSYVLGAIPFFIIGALMLVQPTYLLPLIHDPRGQMISAIGIAGMVAGFGTMRQMLRSVTTV